MTSAGSLRPTVFAVLALLWGLAEATLFFIVPDVPLSFMAARCGLRPVWPLCVAAMLGALIGGAIMAAWGASDAAGAVAMLDRIPGIGGRMIAAAAEAMHTSSWPFAIVRGGVTGTPYKVFAVEAGVAGLPLAPFLAASALARLVRFLASAAIAAAIGRLLRAWGLRAHAISGVVAGFWIVFYAAYWSAVAS